MARYTQFRTPVVQPGSCDKQLVVGHGEIAWIKIGNYKLKFVIQTTQEGRKCAPALVYYPSGKKLDVNIQKVKEKSIAENGLIAPLTNREAAKIAITALCTNKKPEAILKNLRRGAVINVDKHSGRNRAARGETIHV
jgi:hypothetical protein